MTQSRLTRLTRHKVLALTVLTLAVYVCLIATINPAVAQLRGHGGPVRAVAISADGKSILSGSFDSSAIRWSSERNAADQVLRFHDDAVNAVLFLRDGRAVTAGADGRIAIWTSGQPSPQQVLEGHKGPISALALSPDGATLASASWDQTVRLWPLAGGAPRVLEGHSQNVNGVAFTPDGANVVSAAYDLTVRIWPLRAGASPSVSTLPSPLNALAVADGEIVAGGADGKLYFLNAAGQLQSDLEAAPTPVIALAVSPDSKLVASAGIRGSVTIIERKPRKALRTLVGPGLPVWSVAFAADNRTLFTGGADSTIRRWDAMTGDAIGAVAIAGNGDPLAAYADDPGAKIYRACISCHTLSPDEGNRAGPTLSGIFGRRIATYPGYNFSDALKKLDIVWTPETVAKLFEVGPAAYTPGTKMPEQTINSEEDRKALVRFLERATKR